jgi:hypothetical protein
MIKVKHPDGFCNQEQENLLKSCPDSMRRYHELLFTYGNITYRYHQRAANGITEELWLEWLEGLPEKVQAGMKQKGFEECKTILPFTRYVMERNDEGLNEYIERNMDQNDFLEYLKLLQ